MIILDMEMPSNCDECRLKETDQYNGMSRCLAYKMDKPLASNKLYKENLIDNKKPEWCSIKAKIPDNATNGDVIKALFPNCALTCNIMGEEFICEFNGNKKKSIADREWWNAPYKAESEG